MPSPAASKPPRDRAVFINCPFDGTYQPLFRAMCFTIMACGYLPRCALDEADSAAVRFEKILDLICACDLSIHDVSRVELDTTSNLPRFNMPLELGADLALRMRGGAIHEKRRILVLDAEAHRYDKTLSDISGMDIQAHGNAEARIIRAIRDWLNAGHADGPLPGAAAIIDDHAAFRSLVPDLITNLRLDAFDDLPHIDYLHLVERALPMIEAARAA